MIRQWRPWEKSTGPKTENGKKIVSQNAFKGGTWKMLRELSQLLREQNRQLAEVERFDKNDEISVCTKTPS
jgi:hypothetical protein